MKKIVQKITAPIMALVIGLGMIAPVVQTVPAYADGEEDPLWFDMTSNIGIDVHDTGTIVYGENSRYIVKIEGN